MIQALQRLGLLFYLSQVALQAGWKEYGCVATGG